MFLLVTQSVLNRFLFKSQLSIIGMYHLTAVIHFCSLGLEINQFSHSSFTSIYYDANVFVYFTQVEVSKIIENKRRPIVGKVKQLCSTRFWGMCLCKASAPSLRFENNVLQSKEQKLRALKCFRLKDDANTKQI